MSEENENQPPTATFGRDATQPRLPRRNDRHRRPASTPRPRRRYPRRRESTIDGTASTDRENRRFERTVHRWRGSGFRTERGERRWPKAITGEPARAGVRRRDHRDFRQRLWVSCAIRSAISSKRRRIFLSRRKSSAALDCAMACGFTAKPGAEIADHN